MSQWELFLYVNQDFFLFQHFFPWVPFLPTCILVVCFQEEGNYTYIRSSLSVFYVYNFVSYPS